MSDTAGLQLDRAEFDGSHATSCNACAKTLTTEYYEANGAIVCADCCATLRAVGTAGTSLTRGIIAGDGLFVLLILAAGGRAFSSDAPVANERGALTEFIFLILALAIVFRLAA